MRTSWRGVPGRTLGSREGHADLSDRGFGYTVRRTLLTGAATAGLVAAVAGTSAAVQGEVNPGVVPDAQGGTIVSVLPGGFAWQDGIRPGQSIESMSAIDSPGGWELRTSDGTSEFTSDGGPVQAALRDSLPLALAALGAAVLGLLFLRTRRQWVLPAASAAVFASTIPLGLSGSPELSMLALGGAAAIPGFALAAQLRRHAAVRLGLSAALAALLGIWAVARGDGWATYESIDDVRGFVALVALALLVGGRVALPALEGAPMSLTRPRLADAVLVSVATGVVLAAIYVLHLSPVLVGAAALGLVLLLVPIRRVSRSFRNALFADMRAEAVAEGAELERARLARELHDVPLQELIGVLRRLEVMPGAQAESDDLRALAGHLREVASGLRPPVLDDFGLPAALEQVAEESTTQAVPVTTDIDDATGLVPGKRPPPEVELAMYRIAHEAVANALAHARASTVRITARVTPAAVDLEIRDDGSGIEPWRRGKATREKHLGLASMRRRAQAIDAEFSIDADRRRGTTVRAVWRT
jgi:signal transduction histidine kinase